MGLVPRAEVVPAPYVFPQTSLWAGNDGEWSVFGINVGTPGQEFEVLVSTESPEVWVPLPEGCTEDEREDCPDLRGAQPFRGASSPGFQRNLSSTDDRIGIYKLDLKENLGYEGNAEYFYETVRFGAVQDDRELEVERQVVAGLASKDYFLGNIGIGNQPTTFSQDSPPVDSMMQRLKDQQKIPSLSYSYNAGAAYRQKKVPGSLILGGYDASRVIPSENPLTFASSENSGLSVALQSIVGFDTLNGTTSFTAVLGPNAGFLSLIDSTAPHIWLPPDVCDQFEIAFGLVYDEETDLYLINETLRRDIQDSEIEFKIGNSLADITEESSINIVLPFAAFDLTADWPIYEEPTSYFPIRRAVDGESQYTLGRTFLQEAFLIVDYERGNFTVAQATFPDTSPEPSIIAIEAFDSDAEDGEDDDDGGGGGGGGGGLSPGAIAGIVVGTVAAIALISLLLFFLRRRKQKQNPQYHTKPSRLSKYLPFLFSKSGKNGRISQLPDNDIRHQLNGNANDDMLKIQEKAVVSDKAAIGGVADGAGEPVEAPGDAEVNEAPALSPPPPFSPASTVGTNKQGTAAGGMVAELEGNTPRSAENLSLSSGIGRGGEVQQTTRNDAAGDAAADNNNDDKNSIQEENLTVASPTRDTRTDH